MNDEIKEILDKLNYLVKNEMSWWENYTVFSPKDTKQLLDYITNLQQENEKLKKNQRFHKKFGNDYIFCVEGDKETYKDLLLEKQEELEDYKSCCEKAVDYIQNHQLVFELSSKKVISQWFDMFYKDTLNILNGKE